MTDERDLHELAAPLLADPPHPPPPLDELERRVGRRRQRRARAIGLCSVVAVVLVAAGVLALPRDTELRAGDRAAATPTAPPPAFEPGPVQLVVTPESAPLDADRSIEIRNTGTEDYTTCGTYDLFRWDGQTWSSVVRVYLGGGGTMFGTYDPSQNSEACSWSPLTVAAGQSTDLGFDPDTSVWWAVTATATPGTAPLADGWYELREPPDAIATSGEPMGRFEIGPGVSAPSAEPPASADAPVQLAVNPRSAPLDTERTLEIRNPSGETYVSCGTDGKPRLAYDLHRWDGASWEPVATVRVSDDPLVLIGYNPNPGQVDCQTATVAEPGGTATGPFGLGRSVNQVDTGTGIDRLLEPGWYELRQDGTNSTNLAALGRFEITDPATTPPPPPPTTSTTTAPPEDEAPVSVDLYPLDLTPAGEVLPHTVFVVDRDTIALAWNGPCNQPADHVTVDAGDGEIELRLHVGWFATTDCLGEPDDWVVTFDVPLGVSERVRLVARADGTDGETERAPGPIVGSLGGDSRLTRPIPTSFQIFDPDPSGLTVREVRLLLPWPLVDAGVSCDATMSGHNDVMVPRVWIDVMATPSSPCTVASLAMPADAGFRILGFG